MEDEEWDYIIVGAGILGTATASHLKKALPDQKILLIDKYAAAGQGNTIKSNASYRNIFDTHLNVVLASSSIQFYQELERTSNTNLGMKELGYLWLLSDEQYQARNKKNIPCTSEGKTVDVSLFDFLSLNNIQFTIYNQQDLQSMIPELQTSFPSADIDESIETVDINYALLGRQCGTLEPDLLVKAYEYMYKKHGGDYRYGIEVQEILLKEKGQTRELDYIPTIWRESEIGAVRVRNTQTGALSILKTRNLVLTTGAWINQLLDPLGINSTIKPKKRQLFRICGMDKLVKNEHFADKFNSLPFIILPLGGVFLKPIPDANCIDVGCSDDIGRRFETRTPSIDDLVTNKLLDDPQGEMDFYLMNILPILEIYFPNIFSDTIRIDTPSAGMYASSNDKYPVIEKEKTLGNLFFCSGASGSGIMKADSIARIFLTLILGKDTCTLYNGQDVQVADFGLHQRNLPKESLVL
ncbi:MAG: NAD(P)/FAD-dependent oxidoreductase [Candidatus Kariarchaeaceae archaeon]